MSSGIHIKKSNEGKFTATKKRTGKSTAELTHSKNPLTRKRAIFAQNAKKWNHKKKKTNESVIGNNTISLTESKLREIIRESIEEYLSRLNIKRRGHMNTAMSVPVDRLEQI